VRLMALREFPHLVGPVPIVVYAAMFGATAAGQAVGMAVDAIVLRHRILWVPLACSVVLEAIVGARFGAARLLRPLTWPECGRLSLYYSAGLATVSLPLAVWTLASSPSLVRGTAAHDVIVAIGIALAGLAVATAIRQALMSLLSWRRP
jgi:hypothetical protein